MKATKRIMSVFSTMVMLGTALATATSCGPAQTSALPPAELSHTPIVASAGGNSDNTTMWNADTVEQAEEITGYKVCSPAYLPPGFVPASKFMISEIGLPPDPVSKTVTRVWKWKDDSSVYLMLTEAHRSFGISGGEPTEVNGVPGERAVEDSHPGVPPDLTLAWERDGLYLALTGNLKGPLTEDEINKVADSVP